MRKGQEELEELGGPKDTWSQQRGCCSCTWRSLSRVLSDHL